MNLTNTNFLQLTTGPSKQKGEGKQLLSRKGRTKATHIDKQINTESSKAEKTATAKTAAEAAKQEKQRAL